MARVLYMLNKPFGILSQHSDEGGQIGMGSAESALWLRRLFHWST